MAENPYQSPETPQDLPPKKKRARKRWTIQRIVLVYALLLLFFPAAIVAYVLIRGATRKR